jgi:hypothetical protein
MRSEQLYLTDIVAAVDAMARFLTGIEYEEFLNDELRQSAVIQKILVIGEATSHISQQLRDKYPAELSTTMTLGRCCLLAEKHNITLPKLLRQYFSNLLTEDGYFLLGRIPN